MQEIRYTCCCRRALSFIFFNEIEGVDYFILNEAEITLPEFIKDFENGTLKKIYSSDIKPDITQTPVPRFDLIQM